MKIACIAEGDTCNRMIHYRKEGTQDTYCGCTWLRDVQSPRPTAWWVCPKCEEAKPGDPIPE